MNRKIRASLAAFIVLSILGLALLVFIHYKTQEPPQEFREDEKVQVKIDRIHYSGTKEGRVEWELDARSAERSREEDLTLFEDVKITFFADDGTPYVLTSRQGTFKEGAGEINVTGDVKIESVKEGYTLKTDTLKYMIGTKEITTPDKVAMTSGKMDLEGVGLLVRIDSEEFRLLSKVKAVFRDSAVR
ncbi:MAG: LPS export ABC transporter periplasmic protein LptC [Deltaproteobacteria bacterium GWA2_55_10]|nr:MAG: LPS export ABC transporter periplasmic protein LptC [Deltaproteobacteria bacterium GWA2_55_10]